MTMCLQNLVSFCQFVLKILSKNRVLTSIKGSNSVSTLRKTKIYNSNKDLVDNNVYTKFGLNLFILSQDIGQKTNSDINQRPLLCCKFEKKDYDTNIDHVNDNVYTKFGLNRSFCF